MPGVPQSAQPHHAHEASPEEPPRLARRDRDDRIRRGRGRGRSRRRGAGGPGRRRRDAGADLRVVDRPDDRPAERRRQSDEHRRERDLHDNTH